MEKPVKEYMGVRVPPDMLAVLKGRADSQGVKLSQVVIEALALYISRVIENQCRICQTKNPEDAEWCSACGAPLSDAAEIEFRNHAKKICSHNIEICNQNEKILTTTEEYKAEVYNRLREIQTLLKSITNTHNKSLERPASANPRPTDEQTLDIDPE